MKIKNNMQLIHSVLNSPTIRLSQSDKIKLDNRDKKEFFVDFVSALKQKSTNCPDTHFTILEADQIPPNLVINKKAKPKNRETWICFKN